MGRDLSIHDPRADAASVIDEATAHGTQFAVVQLSTVSIAALSHMCLPLSRRGTSPLIWWSQEYRGRSLQTVSRVTGALLSRTQNELAPRRVPRKGVSSRRFSGAS